MSRRTNLLVGLGWWLAIAASGLLSLFLAHRQSMEDEVARAERLASDVLQRTNVLAQQAVMVERRLVDAGIGDACSDAGRALLYQILQEASQLRASSAKTAAPNTGCPPSVTWPAIRPPAAVVAGVP